MFKFIEVFLRGHNGAEIEHLKMWRRGLIKFTKKTEKSRKQYIR